MDLTEKLRTLWRTTPAISQNFPIKLGESHFEEFRITCNSCGCDIPDEHVHGRVSSVIPSVVSIEAVGLCQPCLLLIPLNIRLRSDGSAEFVQHGQWVKSFGVPTALLPRLGYQLVQFFRRTFCTR
ncbi:hypothetical protein [Geomonas subterranea]|uniref:hypothetical protein n=1 Tax=Geomonas subterranea TaxID=2847989 RepID=UPI001CD5A7BE|nr:hypothetical protein [Geomonas fuzhouensis]